MEVDGITVARALEIENASIVSGAISPITGHLILTTGGGAEIDAGLVTTESFEGTLADFNLAMTDADFASLLGAETLENKTVDLADNTLIGTKAQFNTAMSDADFVTVGGLGVGAVLFRKKDASETVSSSTVFQDDNDLVAAVEASAVYNVELNLLWSAAGPSVAGGIKVQLDMPAGSTFEGTLSVRYYMSDGSSEADFYYNDNTNGQGIIADGYGGGIASPIPIRADLLLRTSVTAGDVKLQWAQFTSQAVATRMLMNSFMRLTRVA